MTALRTGLVLMALALSIAGTQWAHATTLRTQLRQISALANAPEAKVDLLAAKLAIDRLIDPAFDETATRRRLDALHAGVRARIPADASNDAKLERLIETLYRPGPWNGGHPFRYDMSDPRGTLVRNKLLSRYLETRKGNCVSMPVLVVILGRRLGLPITLATAPTHMFAKYRRDDGTWANVEATSGGYKLDASYQRELHITPTAIKTRTYLRPLTMRESVASLLETLASDVRSRDDVEGLDVVTETWLRLAPDDVAGLISRHAVFVGRLRAFERAHPTPAAVTMDGWMRYRAWDHEYRRLEARARALGWTPPSDAFEADYTKMLRAVGAPASNAP